MNKKITNKQIEKAKQLLIDAGYFGNLNFHEEDIQDKLEFLREKNPEKYDQFPVKLTEEVIDRIADRADNTIRNDEGNWTNYWYAIELAINNELDID